MSREKSPKKVTCLVINPNSNLVMTEGLDTMIAKLGYGEYSQILTYTAPNGPNSINNEDDARITAEICLHDLESKLGSYDGFIVACYSIHPLVGALRRRLGGSKPVTGIFEASVGTALSLLSTPDSGAFDKFGIVSTGKYWEKALTDGVLDYLGVESLKHCKRFKGVETTGLNADELHTAPQDDVRRRLTEATRRLVKDGDVSVICLGCAGMAGMDEIVAAACVEELGKEKGEKITIIDGVKAGIAMIDGLIRS